MAGISEATRRSKAAGAAAGMMPSSPVRPQTAALQWFGVPKFIAQNGRTTIFRAERPHQLLAYLACRSDWVGRDELATLFWPDRDQSAARRNLRKVLLVAERIAGLPPLERQGDRVRWAPDSDLAQLETASAAAQYEDVLALYRPPLMEGLDVGLPQGSADWLAFKRQHVERLWRQAATVRLRELVGEPAAAALLAEALLAIDPFDDMALLALGEACLALDQAPRALRALQEHHERLASEYGIDPPAPLRVLADRLRCRAPLHPLPSRDGSHTAPVVPERASHLIGRRLELAQLNGLLAEAACRVVTILGPGGIGKSSVARAALRELGRKFAGRTEWVPLDDLRAAAEVPARVATVLGIELRGDADGWVQLQAHLARESRLVVFDNVEHLDGFGAAVASLVGATPQLKLIVTSRTRLSIAGEWLLPLEGLPLPDSEETDIEVLRHNDAVRLFEARALASAPLFSLAEQAAGVVRLLHRLDGLPLAIELAAIWVRLLPAAEIAVELDRSLDLLDQSASGEDAAPPKDRSLRSSFAWSWQLLAPAERGALCRLALLPGPFDRAMAAQAADTSLPLVAALVDKSLVNADGAGRFALHPLLRQCALERVAATVDPDLTARRHAAYMAQWLGRFEDPSRYVSTEMLLAMDHELAHVRAAWRWAVAKQEPELICRGAPTVMRYFDARGGWADGVELMTEAVDAFTDDTPAAQRARLFAAGALAQLQVRMARFVEGESTARLALQLATALDHRNGLKSSVNLIGMSLYRQGRLEQARDYFERSLGYAREDGDEPRLAMVFAHLAIVESALGRYEAAQALYRESAALAHRIGSVPSLAAALNNLAMTQLAIGDASAALVSATEALALYTKAELRSRRPIALLNMATAQHLLGAKDDAARTYEKGLAAARENGEPDSVFEALVGSARVAAESGEPERLAWARVRLAEAIVVAKGIGSEEQLLKAVLVAAQILMNEGDAVRARTIGAWALAQPGMNPVEARRWQRRCSATKVTGAADDADVLTAAATLPDVIALIERGLAASRNAGGTRSP